MLGTARAGVIVALSILLQGAISAPGAWTQVHGDAQRSGQAFVREGPLDVLGVHDLLQPGESLKAVVGPSLVDTPHGLMGIARKENGDCILVRVRDLSRLLVDRIPLTNCRYAYFQGYDPVSDSLYLCSIEGPDGPIFQSRRASDGTLQMRLKPTDLPNVLADGVALWSCAGVAFDFKARFAIVPVQSSRTGADFPRNRIVKLHLDTFTVQWSRQIDASTGYFSSLPSELQRDRDRDGAGANFLPLVATLISGGVVVVGASLCADSPVCDPPRGDITKYTSPFPVELGAAWFDLDGGFHGILLAREDNGINPRRSCLAASDARLERVRTGSLGAVASGSEAVLHLGQCLYKLRANEPEPVVKLQVPSLDYREGGDLGTAPGAWTQESIVMPIRKTIAAFHPVELLGLWSWPMDEPGVTPQVILAAPRDIYWVLAGPGARRDAVDTGEPAILYKLDASAAKESRKPLLVQKVTVPVQSFRATEDAVAVTPSKIDTPVRNFSRFISYFNRGPELTPLANGDLVVSDMSGRIVHLGTCPLTRRPSLDPETLFPPLNRPFSLRIQPPADPTVRSFTVIWGDGESGFLPMPQDGTAAIATHTYTRAGRVEVLVTAGFSDNRTGSSVATLDVGSHPSRLTPMQVWFARENQDLTFFVLGLLVTLLGAVWALARRTYRRSRIEARLRRLDAVREGAGEDLPGALRLLDTFRDDLRSDLASGRLDDGQFSVVHAAAMQLQRALRRRLFAPFEGRMSRHFHRQLEAALEDGVVNADEATSLSESLRREQNLSTEERRRIAQLLGA